HLGEMEVRPQTFASIELFLRNERVSILVATFPQPGERAFVFIEGRLCLATARRALFDFGARAGCSLGLLRNRGAYDGDPLARRAKLVLAKVAQPAGLDGRRKPLAVDGPDRLPEVITWREGFRSIRGKLE